MPIRPDQRALYPSDWSAISRAVKEAAGWRCVECGVAHGATGARGADGEWYDQHEIDNLNSDHGFSLWPDGYPKIITICLTVGHLGTPMELPFHLHVTGVAQANQVVGIVGFGLSCEAERLEWDAMVHDGTLAKLLGGATTGGARLVVALPNAPSRLAPGGSVVAGAAAAPVWVFLTEFHLLGEPGESAYVAAETPPLPQVKATDLVGLSARLARCLTKPALVPADQDSQASLRAGLLAFRRLVGGDGEHGPADDAGFFAFAAAGRATDAGELMTSPALAAEFVATGHRARLARRIGGCRCGEHLPASYTDLFGGAASWSCHTLSIPYRTDLDHDPTNNDLGNLAALCCRCHNRYDGKVRARHAAETRLRKRGQAPLVGLEVGA